MGVPKQRWTVEEEAALKAGVSKHGAGKWCTILKDPEFSGALCSRSNVDLKDKWRNLCVISFGFGSREKARIALKRRRESTNSDESQEILSIAYGNPDDSNVLDVKPLAVASETVQFPGREKSIKRLDKYIMEAITNLEEPLGSSKSSIALWIEEQYEERANFHEELSARLKVLISKGKLNKMKGNYMKSQKRSSKHSSLDGEQSVITGKDKDVSSGPLSKPKIDAELARMKHMTAEEAAVAAAQAVAEAEAAIAEAEEAVREADALEADAEAAQAFAEAAKQAIIHRNAAKQMLRV